jgi:lysosomal Pro-X carboxypeptidase
LWDPFSSGGVLKNISSTVQALLMPKTTHQVDLLASHPNDTLIVVQTREAHKRWIKKWIDDYRLSDIP